MQQCVLLIVIQGQFLQPDLVEQSEAGIFQFNLGIPLVGQIAQNLLGQPVLTKWREQEQVCTQQQRQQAADRPFQYPSRFFQIKISVKLHHVATVANLPSG